MSTNSQEDDLRVTNNKSFYLRKGEKRMCIRKSELEAKVEEIRRYKAMIEEATNIQKALEQEIVSYMNENNLTEEITDSAKILYKSQTRSTLDKKKLEEDLGSLEEYTKVTTYNVLRIY